MPKKLDFAEYLVVIQEANGVSNVQLAKALGYNPNVISIFRRTNPPTKFPMEKVEAAAIALQVDPAMMLLRWFECYKPEVASILKKYKMLPDELK